MNISAFYNSVDRDSAVLIIKSICKVY